MEATNAALGKNQSERDLPQPRSFPFSSAAARRLLYLPGQKQQCQRLKQVISLFLTGLFRASVRGKWYGSEGS